MCEKKIIDLEEELRVVGQNLQQLEVRKCFICNRNLGKGYKHDKRLPGLLSVLSEVAEYVYYYMLYIFSKILIHNLIS